MCRLGDVLCVGLGCISRGIGDMGMYFVRVWGCIVCRFGDVFHAGLGSVLCAGVGIYVVPVWECSVCRLGDVFCEGFGMYCV